MQINPALQTPAAPVAAGEAVNKSALVFMDLASFQRLIAATEEKARTAGYIEGLKDSRRVLLAQQSA